MLSAVKKGKKVNEEEMPPPVASGKSSAALPRAESMGDQDQILEEGEKEGFATDLELKDPNDAELTENITALPSQDVETNVIGEGVAFENGKLFRCCPFPYNIFILNIK